MVPVAVIELNEIARRARPAGGPAGSWPRTSRRRPGVPYMSRTALRLTGKVRQVRHRRSACGRPSRTGRCAWRFPDRPTTLPSSRLRACTASTTSRCRSASDPRRVGQVQDRIAGAAQVDALESARQEAAVPLPGGDRLRLPELPVEVSTTKPGRSSLSLPRPYRPRSPWPAGRRSSCRCS